MKKYKRLLESYLEVQAVDMFTKKVVEQTISQIENGDRNLKPEEIIKLSQIFNVDCDIILGVSKEPEVVIESKRKKKESGLKQEIRINVPQKNLQKFKEVLLYILNKVGSKPNIGETVIYKLLYFIDLDFYELFEEQLIGATYIKNEYGPTPVEFKKIIDEMIKNEEIELVESKYFKYPQRKYLPLRTPVLKILDGRELNLIDNVLDRFSDMNAAQISEYSHKDVPWLAAENGKCIEYESVFYRTPEFSVRDNEGQ